MTLLDSIKAALERAKRATTEAPLREAQRAAETELENAHRARVAAEREAPKTVPEASLTEARAAAKLAVLKENNEDYAGAFRSVWQTLSSLDKSDERFFDPLFESKPRLKAIDEIARRVQMLHYDLLCPEMGKQDVNRSAFILTGPAGVGKTTILRGVAAVLAVIAPHMVVARHELTDDPATWLLPSELLQRAAKQAMGEDAFARADAAARAAAAAGAFYSAIDLYTVELPRHGYSCALLLDEVQLVYEATTEADRARAKAIISMLARFGKSSRTLAIVTGSSHNTRALLHKDPHLAAKHDGFANLNHTVYHARSIDPIRQKSDLDAVLRPYGKEKEALTVFWATGGLAGDIAQFVSGTELDQEKDGQLIVEAMQASPALERVVYNLIPPSDEKDWTLPTITHEKATFYLKVFGELNRGHPHDWIDAGFIVKSGPARYELAQPSLIPFLRETLSAGGAMERFAVEATLRGWDRAPSAGHLNERYVLRRAAEEKLLGDEPHHHPQWNARRLRFVLKGAPKRVVVESVGEGAPDSRVGELPANRRPIALKELLGELFNSFAGEQGIDGLVLARDPQSNTTIHVDLIQVKTGRMSMSIDRGEMNGITARAEAGWEMLLENLLAVFAERYSFTRRSFTLITNKTIEEPARDALVVYQQPFPESKIIDQEGFKRRILDADLRTRVDRGGG
jgi:hypothetical protein